MRWPIRRKNATDRAPHAAPTATVAAGTAEIAPPHRAPAVAVESPPRRDWAALPALPTTVAPVILATEARPFTPALAARQNIAVTGRLTHARRAEAPAGKVAAKVVPGTTVDPDARLHAGDTALPRAEHRMLHAAPPETRPAPQPEPIAPVAPPRASIEVTEPPPVVVEAPPTTPPPMQLTELDVAIGAAFERAGLTPPELGAAPPAPAPEPVRPEPPRQRRNLADSRRLGLGPAYHGSLPEAMRAERERITRAEPVPDTVRAVVRDTLGVDIGEKMVHRGPEVSAEARALGAQAFTRDREMFVADEVGPLDTPQGRATVAHEMTHLAQQIADTVVPDDHTAEGHRQEAAAQEMERFVRGDAGAPRPKMLHQTRGHQADVPPAELAEAVRATMRELIEQGVARDDGAGGIEFTRPPETMTARPVPSGGASGTQRLTDIAAPHQAPSGRSEVAMRAEGFGREALGMFQAEALSTMSSVFGFSEDFEEEIQASVDADDRRARIEEYQERRLAHVKATELERRNTALTAAHRPPIEELPEEISDAFAEQISEEVERRVELLRDTEADAVRKLNDSRREGQKAIENVDRDKYEEAFTALFGDPDSDETPTDEEVARLLGAAAEQTQRDNESARQARQQAAAAGGASAAAGAAAGAAAAAAGGAAASMDHVRGAGGATGGVGRGGAGGRTAGAAATGTHRTGATGGGATRTGADDDEVGQWEDRDVSFGRRMGSLGAQVGFEVLGEELDTIGSVLGFSDSFSEELTGGLERDRQDAMARIRGDAPAGAAAGAATGVGPEGAPGSVGADGSGAQPDSDPAARSGSVAARPTRVSETGDEIIDADRLDMNELANRIYPNLRSMLRQELLIDRERAGLLNDFR